MTKIRPIVFSCVFLFLMQFIAGQEQFCRISGRISDAENMPVYLANITAENSSYIAVTDQQGEYSIKLPANKEFILVFSCMGFSSIHIPISGKPGEEIILNLQLQITYKPMGEIRITALNQAGNNLTRIDSKTLESLPNASGNLETLLKTLPGVYSNNELSSQYSVRGGNFDENLVYINDIEIYRPFLIRSSQQEGLSIINPDLVSGIQFSAGGFDASYGDKMSSVLDITYRQPNQTGGSAALSLLGGSLHLEGASKDKRFTHLSGFRYKTNQYLLNSLDTKGEYKPSFIDFQTNLNYRVNDKLEIGFLGNVSMNSFRFIPATRETEFGTVSTALNLKIYYDGQEIDQYKTWFGAFTGTYKPTVHTKIKIIASGYTTREEETFDIQGQYLINELDTRQGSASFGDSIKNIGVGTFLDHARNFLDVSVFSISLMGEYNNNFSIKWGFKYQQENIHDYLAEWQMIDSAGYSLPHTGEEVNLINPVHATNTIHPFRTTGYLQTSKGLKLTSGLLQLAGGIRMNYYSLNEQFFLNPRFWLQFLPEALRDMHIRLACGYYFQPPFYKEMRNRLGVLNTNLRAQKSFQTLLGVDYYFKAWERPFKFTAEAYFKYLYDLVPYKLDNVRISYLAQNDAQGFTTGIDFKINGEFVKGTDSWASVSIMRSLEERLSLVMDEMGKPVNAGFYPRPTDQLINIGLFFQDYLPYNPSYRVNIYLLYGTGLPVSAPNTDRYDQTFRMPAYKRVDIGFTKVIKDDEVQARSPIWGHFRSVMISGEIFNLLGVNNTISYMWVKTVSNLQQMPAMFAVPNYLTSRRFNIKFSIKF